MLEFWISDLLIMCEMQFEVPCSNWTWHFQCRDTYEAILEKTQPGQSLNTFLASNESIGCGSSDFDFSKSTDDLVDICLILSFICAKCVTPTNTSSASDILSINLGDKFIPPRAITGFSALELTSSLNDLFSSGLSNISKNSTDRWMRLFLAYWISGLTCYTLEDLFMSVAVQMDIVKQCERIAEGNNMLTYFEGTEKASDRYGITKLDTDFKDMRNDLVHEGKLSGSNFNGKNKSQCADVIAKTLNWIDSYVLQVLSISGYFSGNERWKSLDIESGLPSFSLL